MFIVKYDCVAALASFIAWSADAGGETFTGEGSVGPVWVGVAEVLVGELESDGFGSGVEQEASAIALVTAMARIAVVVRSRFISWPLTSRPY
ncbi:MAG: hypothetical protein L0G87_00495 [Renibacterium salmoninarum]|nr:hypothetical protein [Renibacterium salmoninarum]